MTEFERLERLQFEIAEKLEQYGEDPALVRFFSGALETLEKTKLNMSVLEAQKES